MSDTILEEDALCTVCLDLYHDPVLLECSHNLCTKCAVTLFDFESKLSVGTADPALCKPVGGAPPPRQGAHGPRLTCPECRAVTNMPENGVEGLKKNLVLRNMVDTLRERRAVREKTKCGVCEERPALWECKECQFEMCQECRDTDHRRGRYKEHTIFPLGKLAKMRPRKCKDHDGYLTDLYCTQCQTAVCLLCNYMGGHKGHSVEPISEAIDTIKKKLRTATEEVDTRAQQVAVTIAEVETHAGPAIAKKCEEAVVTVKQHFSALHEILTTRQEHLLTQIQTIRDTKTLGLATHIETLKAVSGQMEVATKTCRKIMDESHYSDLLRSKDSIYNRLTQLSAVRWSSKAPTSDCDLRVSFDATDASVRRLLADVGNVTCKDPSARGSLVEIPQPNATQQFPAAPLGREEAPSLAREPQAAARFGAAPFLTLNVGAGGGRGKAPREEPSPHPTVLQPMAPALLPSAGGGKRAKKQHVVPTSSGPQGKESVADGAGNADNADGKKWILRI